MKKTHPMSGKWWLAPLTHLPHLALDTDSPFPRANRLIRPILLAFTPSSHYPRTTAHAVRGFSSPPTRMLVRPKEMGHVACVLAWVKTDTFRTSLPNTLMAYIKTHCSFTMALVASLTSCTGNHLQLTIFVCVDSTTCGNWLEKKGSLKSTSKCYLPCRRSASPRLTMSCMLASRMVWVFTQCLILSKRQQREYII